MKKTTFILAALFVATFANAQITKEWTGHIYGFGSSLQILESPADDYNYKRDIIGNYLTSLRGADSGEYLDIVDASSLKTVKSFFLAEEDDWFGMKDNEDGPLFLSKGIFSIDGKWAGLVFVITKEGEFENEMFGHVTYGIITEVQVRNEDGVTLATIPYYSTWYHPYGDFKNPIKLIKAGNSFKLVVPKASEEDPENRNVDIYSLPGDGSAQDLISISSPNNMPSRKYIQNNQVLIDNDKSTYTVTGQKVR